MEHRLVDAVLAAAGTGLIIGGLTAGQPGRGGGAGPGRRSRPRSRPSDRLLPAGTLRARPGLPTTILSRGLLTFAYFGADAFVTLTIVTVRHHSLALAGVAVTGSTLSWTAGSWVQARLNQRVEGRRMVQVGLSLVLLGVAGMLAVLRPGVPVGLAVVAWSVAGLGMGLSYAPLSLMMLREAPAGREGWASASLNLVRRAGIGPRRRARRSGHRRRRRRGWALSSGRGGGLLPPCRRSRGGPGAQRTAAPASLPRRGPSCPAPA